ncbi:MAG TPA: glycosyltransferase family 2 protein [Leptolyngbyaceae cyanobacterium]
MVKYWPKISLVTPSLNQAQFLEATIQSILSQNYPNLEYIIIDGGSTDGSLEIIKKYESNLHFWCTEPDGGQYDAINKGFAHSTGEIKAWLNSDDMQYPWALRTVASIMSELPQVEWLTTLSPGFWDWHGFCTGFASIPGYSREAFLDSCYLPGSNRPTGWVQQESTFWRHSLWEKVGSSISTKFNLAGDFDLWTRFYLHTDLYGTFSPLGGFRTQINQKSFQREQYYLEAEKSLSAMQESLNWSPKWPRSVSYKLKLHKIPKISKITEGIYSYVGKRIVRRKSNLPDSFWDIEDYRFFL